jgi:hypothetical protein
MINMVLSQYFDFKIRSAFKCIIILLAQQHLKKDNFFVYWFTNNLFFKN